MRTNYRSAQSIVQAGNALMRGRGEEARADRAEMGAVTLADLKEFVPSCPERDAHDGDQITPATLRLAWGLLRDEKDVVLLCRTNHVPRYVRGKANRSLTGFLEHVRSFLPEDDRARITASTAHRHKGLESPAVIVLDATERRYPLVHSDWVFQRVFGDSIDSLEEEERRLFYVAMTRAQESLVLVTEEGRKSPFLADIGRVCKLTSVPWEELAPVPRLGDRRVEVRVHDAYAVKEHLKRRRYSWNAQDKYWYRSEPAAGFALDKLCEEPWARPGIRIEVYDDGGGLIGRTVC